MCDEKMVWIFVYGTLKRGFPLYTGKEKKIVEDSIKGSIYDLGGCPALRLDQTSGDDSSSVVHGELHLVPIGLIPLYDYIEGRFFQRTEVVTLNGVPAQTYEFIGHQCKGGDKIESGVWDKSFNLWGGA